MIIITGASSGIGKETALLLAKNKCDLILMARRAEKLSEVVQECNKYGAFTQAFAIDIADSNALSKWAKENQTLLQKTSVLINNAGLARGLKTFDQVEMNEWDQMIDTNIKSVFHLTSLVLPHFINNKTGHIINLGSVAGHHIYPKGNVYCATKHAIHAFSQSLRVDLLGKNIRVTEISPGMVETEFSEVRLQNKELAKKVYEGMTPLTPFDIAETIWWSINRPKHVNIEEIIIYPTDQASPTLVNRK